MNRATRRRIQRNTDGRLGIVEGYDIKAEVSQKYHAQRADLDAPVPGQHMWVMAGVWKVSAPAAERHELDYENLMSLEGPCCYWCELPFSMTAPRCPGDASS